MPNRTLSTLPADANPAAGRDDQGGCDLRQSQWISTAQHKPKDRFGFWLDAIAAHSQAFAMPSTPVHDYRGTALVRERDGITIMQMVSDPLGLRHLSEQAARQSPDRVLLSWCVQVDGGIESGGRFAQLSDGAVHFRDHRGPGSSWTHGPAREAWLLVPREWLLASGKLVRDFDGVAFQADHFLAKLMAARIRAVVRAVDDTTGTGFQRTLEELRQSVEDAFAARHVDSHERKLLEQAQQLSRIKAYMCRHAGDAEHTPDRMADALGITRSTLYRLLRKEGLQVAAHAAEHRLVAIARMLRDPIWVDQPVGEIAARWGHGDQAYFSRAFKRRFGVTPSQWRTTGPVPEAPRAHA